MVKQEVRGELVTTASLIRQKRKKKKTRVAALSQRENYHVRVIANHYF